MKYVLKYASIAAALLALSVGCTSYRSSSERSGQDERMEQEGPEGEEENEQEVPYQSLPAAARAAAVKALAGATDFSAEKESERGVTHFEVVGKKGGKAITVTLSGAGEIVELETEIFYAELPAAVRERLKREYPGVSFEIVELVEPRYFEVKFKTDGNWHEVQIYPSGLVKKD
jgi:uncharacterized membrane protein YkoI